MSTINLERNIIYRHWWILHDVIPQLESSKLYLFISFFDQSLLRNNVFMDYVTLVLKFGVFIIKLVSIYALCNFSNLNRSKTPSFIFVSPMSSFNLLSLFIRVKKIEHDLRAASPLAFIANLFHVTFVLSFHSYFFFQNSFLVFIKVFVITFKFIALELTIFLFCFSFLFSSILGPYFVVSTKMTWCICMYCAMC